MRRIVYLLLLAVIGSAIAYYAVAWQRMKKLNVNTVSKAAEYEKLCKVVLGQAENFESYQLEGKDQINYAKFRVSPEGLQKFIATNHFEENLSKEEPAFEQAILEVRNIETLASAANGATQQVFNWWLPTFVPEVACTTEKQTWVVGKTATTDSNYWIYLSAVSR